MSTETVEVQKTEYPDKIVFEIDLGTYERAFPKHVEVKIKGKSKDGLSTHKSHTF